MPRTKLNIEQILTNWEGFTARQECRTRFENPHKDAYYRALWFKGYNDANEGMERPESAPADCYWIVDDVISNSSKEGYCVMFGDPVKAIGTTQGEFLLLREALASIPAGETVYRVKLARRHGKHSAELIEK